MIIAIVFTHSGDHSILYRMKLRLLLSLVVFPMLVNAEDPYRNDPLADDLILKPIKTNIPDCTLKPLLGEPGDRKEDALAKLMREQRDSLAEKCVITTYSIPKPGEPEHSTSKVQTIIEYDPATGDGKVYAADEFGLKSLDKGQVGTVKLQSGSGDLIVYPLDRFGMTDHFNPTQVIEGVKLPSFVKGQGEPCPALSTSSSNLKVYPTDDLGYRKLFADPLGNAEIDCKK